MIDKKAFKNRLWEIEGYCGFDSHNEFARAVGISPSTVHYWFDAGGHLPSLDSIGAILDALPYLNAKWLITGEGLMTNGRR